MDCIVLLLMCLHQVLERVCKEVAKQAALYQESIRDAAELQDTTGVELTQVRDMQHPTDGCAILHGTAA